jgi:GTP-binding protein
VLTKADAAKEAERPALLAATDAALSRHPAAHPQVLVTSARTGPGIAELRAAMAQLINERARG